jgi:predicted dehydrogenase
MISDGTAEAPLGIGVIGAGYWGPNVIRNVADCPRAEVAAIADMKPERLAPMKRRYPSAMVTTSAEELLAEPSVSAVAITTPVSQHYPLARAALEAGKHVLVAKPMTATLAEADALIELARARDRVLMVDHTFVYTGAVRKIRSLLDEGRLGDLLYIDSVRINLGLFQHDVNVVWDLAAHDFAILDHLLDERPVTLRAIGSSHSASGLEDVAYLHLEYTNDLIAHCHVSWLSPVKIRQTLIGGSQQMVVWNDLAADEKVRIYDRGIDLTTSEEDVYRTMVSYRMGDAMIPTLERHEALALEIEHFVDCVRGDAEPTTGGEAGRQVVRLLEATSMSLREGGRAIDLEGELSVRPPTAAAEEVR